MANDGDRDRSARQRTWAKIGGGILAGAVALVAGIAFLAPLLADRRCTVHPVATVASPGGKWRAEQVRETCDDDPVPRIVVWVSTERPVNLGGTRWSAFRAAAPQPGDAPGNREPVRLQLVWVGESELQIAHPRGITLEQREPTERGVRVTYRERP